MFKKGAKTGQAFFSSQSRQRLASLSHETCCLHLPPPLLHSHVLPELWVRFAGSLAAESFGDSILHQGPIGIQGSRMNPDVATSSNVSPNTEDTLAVVALAQQHFVFLGQPFVTWCTIRQQQGLSAAFVFLTNVIHSMCFENALLRLRRRLPFVGRGCNWQLVEIHDPAGVGGMEQQSNHPTKAYTVQTSCVERITRSACSRAT